MTPLKETETRLAAARAYVAAALRIRTRDGFPVLKACRKEDLDEIDSQVLAKLRCIGSGEPWAKKARAVLEREDAARDVLFAMCSVPGAACVQAGTDALIRHGLREDWAWETAGLIESCNRHLQESLRKLDHLAQSGAAVGPWHATPEFDRAITLCAYASDRVTLARDDDIPNLSQNEWNVIVRQAQTIPGLAEDAGRMVCDKVFRNLKAAGFDYRQNPNSPVTWKSLDNHLKRFAVRLWWTRGVMPIPGRFREHLCRLVSFAARQTYLSEDPRCRAAAELLGRLVSGLSVIADRNRLGAVYELEAETARAASHRVSLICSYLEKRGGCPGIIRELCNCEPLERTQLLGWQEDIEAAGRGITWHNGMETEPSTSRASTECSGEAPGASTECASARAGVNRSFGSLFDEQ